MDLQGLHIITATDFSIHSPEEEYDKYTFNNCNFHGVDLSDKVFRNCTFENCDFCLVKLKNTTLENIRFINCKLLGIQFQETNPFLISLYFEGCLLRLSAFYQMKLKKTKFINCDMQETDLAETDLTGAEFTNCDFKEALFSGTNLEKADLSTSFHYRIDPDNNRIRQAVFSYPEVLRLLDKYDISIH